MDAISHLLSDFEVAWQRFESGASLRSSFSTDLLLSVLRRKFFTKVEILFSDTNFAALSVDLSELKIRTSSRSLVCLTRIKESSTDTPEVFRKFTTTYYAESTPGYYGIAIVAGDSTELKRKCRAFPHLVVIDYQQLKGIIKAKLWIEKLVELLTTGKDPKVVSPYDETGVCPTEMFFGRDNEIKRLTSHARGHGYSIVGCRRVGKSSLLLKIKQHYDEIGEATYYIDCQTCRSTGTFYDEIVRRTNRRDYESRKHWTLKGYLIRLAAMNQKPLNLFLDEVDWVINEDKENEYQYMRELLSAERSGKVSFRLWMAGFKDLYWAVTERLSPLYGKTTAVELKQLDYQESKGLILKPLSQLGYRFKNEELITKKIYEDTAGHPAFTQLYCRILVDTMNEGNKKLINLDHLERVTKKNDLIDYVLDTFVINTSSLEKMIVLAVLDKKNFTQKEVHDLLKEKFDLKLDYKPLYNELRDLRFGGILLQNEGSFSFQYPIMTKIIRRFENPDYIRDEHIEEAREAAEKVNAKAKLGKTFR